MLELANKSPRRVESAPLPYTIKRGELKLRVASETVTGTVQLQGETFNKGETKVALTSGMTILDARQEGHVLPLEQEGGTYKPPFWPARLNSPLFSTPVSR